MVTRNIHFCPHSSSSNTTNISRADLSISGLERDQNASSPQNIAHEADRWKILQAHSTLEQTPFERLSENVPQIRYGHERLEPNDEDDSKGIVNGVVDCKAAKGPSRRLRILAIVLIVAIVVAIVLSATLTQSLKHHHEHQPRFADLGSGPPSTSGVFNGTGLSTIERGDFDDYHHLFYQDFRGQIKHLISHDPRTNWTESGDSDTIPLDARNRTPIASANAGGGIHLFYVDDIHQVREQFLQKDRRNWIELYPGSDHRTTSDSLVIPLDVYVLTPDYDTTPRLLLSYGSADGSVHQVVSDSTSPDIFSSVLANSNGSSAVAVYDDTQLLTIDEQTSQIKLWSTSDRSSLGESTPTYQGLAANSSTHPYTPLRARGNSVYFVDPARYIRRIEPSPGASLQYPIYVSEISVPQVDPGGQIAFTRVPNIVYLQTEGNRISAYAENENGSFTQVASPV